MPFYSVKNIFPIFIAATASLVLSPLCCRVAPLIGAMDVPRDSRRMHRRPIPRAGGLAILPAIFIAFAALGSPLSMTLLIGGSVIFAAGISDDVLGLTPFQKLSAQSTAAALTLITGRGILLPESAALIHLITAFLWILMLVNAFNLIDGLDGLCSGIGLTASLFLFFILGSVEGLIVSAALIGFLPLNRHPAGIFLGDSGAMLIGFFVSVLSLPMILGEAGDRAIPSAILLFAVPIFDTLSAFLRRALSGRSPFSPDRLHLHHRLVDSGTPHGRASFLIVALSAAFGCVGVLIFFRGLSFVTLACIVLLSASCLCLLPMTRKQRG